MDNQKEDAGLDFDESDQVGMIEMLRQSHLSLPSHNGHTLKECPVCQMFFIQEPHPEGKPIGELVDL